MAHQSDHSSFSIRHPLFVALLHSVIPYLAIIALFAICALLVDPRGEFPLNDDWSYARAALRLGIQGRMQVDEWSAPNLVGQALYGGMLIKIAGPSFLVLRLSTIVLSCLAACLFWAILRRLNCPRGLSTVAVLAWIFNPVWFCLSFTYMTEVPFLFCIMLSVLLYAMYLNKDHLWLLAASGLALGYAFLIRQTAALFMGPMFAALALAVVRGNRMRRIARVILWAGIVFLFIAGYEIWSLYHGGATPAARRKIELLAKITSTQILGNSFGLLFYLSFFALPLLIYLVPRLVRLSSEAGRMIWLLTAGWLLISGAGLWWFYARYGNLPYLPSGAFHARMPFLLNVLYDTGLGPITLDPTYYGRTPTPTYQDVWWLVTFFSALGAVVIGLLLTVSVIRFRWCPAEPIRQDFLLFSGLSLALVAAFEVIFSHIQEGGLFDRHILTASLPLLFLAVLAEPGGLNRAYQREKPASSNSCSGEHSGPGQQRKPGKQSAVLTLLSTIPAGLLLLVVAWFSIAATHDYLTWNRLRWDLGNELVGARVDPLTVSGGFEFNAWHNYDTFRGRGDIGKVYYWWYDRLDYLITMEEQEAYIVMKKKEYFSWLHRRNLPVYLLKKEAQN